jgi:hypothetical protein
MQAELEGMTNSLMILMRWTRSDSEIVERMISIENDDQTWDRT